MPRVLKESEKEQTKLLATALNTSAVNTTVVGLVTPIVAAIYGIPSAPQWDHLLPACLIWPAAGFMLHIIARFVLKELDP